MRQIREGDGHQSWCVNMGKADFRSDSSRYNPTLEAKWGKKRESLGRTVTQSSRGRSVESGWERREWRNPASARTSAARICRGGLDEREGESDVWPLEATGAESQLSYEGGSNRIWRGGQGGKKRSRDE